MWIDHIKVVSYRDEVILGVTRRNSIFASIADIISYGDGIAATHNVTSWLRNLRNKIYFARSKISTGAFLTHPV